MLLTFQWDAGNTHHIVDNYPEGDNITNEVKSLFSGSNFSPLPDRIDALGEQRYKAVAVSNLNRIYMLLLQSGITKFVLVVTD